MDMGGSDIGRHPTITTAGTLEITDTKGVLAFGTTPVIMITTQVNMSVTETTTIINPAITTSTKLVTGTDSVEEAAATVVITTRI